MFSILKRGIHGIYQHVSEAHLQRYLHEFDFRYNNRVALGIDDAERATRAIQGAAGKRLTYRQPRNQTQEAVPPKPLWPDGSPYREPVQLKFPL
jgi:ISXO2-like transposase domain